MAGIGMVVVAAVFMIWARLRPVVVPDEPDDAGSPQAGPARTEPVCRAVVR